MEKNKKLKTQNEGSIGVGEIIERPPVVVVMGHIDHGKSTLLDYIRKTNVVEKEAGGITQRLSAYELVHKDRTGREKKITFLDTPGHEAFGKMRFHGAEIADIAIIVVSAEEGVKAQTLEALSCIKKSKIPFVVAINKIDKPNADIEKTKQNLLKNEIYLEGLGGDVPWVSISAKTGKGIPELLDMVLLVAELEELVGDEEKNAEGIVIEAHRDKMRGISATLVIKDGTLRTGMYISSGDSISPVRIMENFLGEGIKEATISSAVQVIGFNKMPQSGKPFSSFNTKREAEGALVHTTKLRDHKAESPGEGEDKEIIEIPVILVVDVHGALDAIEHEIENLADENVRIKIVQSGVGTISENDIKIAGGKAGTIVVGFNTAVDAHAAALAGRLGIEVKVFDVIYKLSEWLKEVVDERKASAKTEEVTGKAEILKVFNKTKDKQVIGGRVGDGALSVKADVKILRKDTEIGKGKILNLQQQKANTKQVSSGSEFGAQVQSKVEIIEGDVLESFTTIK